MDSNTFNEILELGAETGVIDILFAVGKPPRMKKFEWVENKSAALTAADTEFIARTILSKGTVYDWDNFQNAEVAYEVDKIGRFRASIFKQRGLFRIVMRYIPIEVRGISDLNLPKEISELANLERGLILVTGRTTQGKSTTISALLQQINETRNAHIITIEDPVEFIYQEDQAIITQREVINDISDYKMGIRFALRQSPDVIMIGEIRERETFEAVLDAAETGHLVISAIHTSDVLSTIDRLLGFFSHDERKSIQDRLSNTLEAIVSLRLLSGITSNKIPAVEILRVNGTVADCLRKCDSNTFHETIVTAMSKGEHYYGMWTFDQYISRLLADGKVSPEVAKAAATKKTEIERDQILQGISS